MSKIKYIIILLLTQLTSCYIYGQCEGDNTFQGTTNSEWELASNWSTGCVPTSPIIGQISIAADCTISSGNYTFSSESRLQINDEIIFTDNSSNGLIISGELTGEGTYVGNITLNGDIIPGDVAPPPAATCGYLLNYEGQSYTTTQIGDQCWMAENLNIGTMIHGTNSMTNNGTIEKYCYGNDPAECTIYGGLYQWDEIMQYTTIESTQGICPTGWHLPSDDELKTLEITLGMTQAEVDMEDYRGTDQGSQLAGNEVLWESGALDQDAKFNTSGFMILPAGFRNTFGTLSLQSTSASIWSSSESDEDGGWYRRLYFDLTQINRVSGTKKFGFSVRCIKD